MTSERHRIQDLLHVVDRSLFAMKRKSLRQAEKRAARELAALQSEEGDPQPSISNPETQPSATEVKLSVNTAIVMEEKFASQAERPAPPKSRMRRVRDHMEEQRRAAEEKLLKTIEEKEQEVLCEKEEAARMHKKIDSAAVAMHRLLGRIERLEQNLTEERTHSEHETRGLHVEIVLERERSTCLERELAEANIQAATITAETERLEQSLVEEKQRAASLRERLTQANAKALSAEEACLCLEHVLADTQASIMAMESSHINERQLLEETVSILEIKLVEEDRKTKDALNGQFQAEMALAQVQTNLVDTERHLTEEKQGLENRLFKEEQVSKLAHKAFSQIEGELALTRASMVAMETERDSLRTEKKDLDERQEVDFLQWQAERKSLQAEVTKTTASRVKAKKALTLALSRLVEVSQIRLSQDARLARQGEEITDLKAKHQVATEKMMDQMIKREKEIKVLIEEKIQALAAQGRTGKSLAQAQGSLMELKQSSLEAEKGLCRLFAERMEEISSLNKETLHTMCLQWQAVSDRVMERNDKEWRRKVEGLDIQMRQLEEEKKEAQKELHLALSQIQTVSDGRIGRFLLKKAKRKMEKEQLKES